MSDGNDRLISLPENWEQQCKEAEAAGLDPMRALSARLGVAGGDYTEQCDYAPDPEVWAYYRKLGSQQ